MELAIKQTTEFKPITGSWTGRIALISDNEILIKNKVQALTTLGFNVITISFDIWNSSLFSKTDFPLFLIDSTNSFSDSSLPIINNISECNTQALIELLRKKIPFCENALSDELLMNNFSIENELQEEMNSFLIELIHQFFETVELDLPNLEKLMDKNDHASLNKKFHTYKSTFATFGLVKAQEEFGYWQKNKLFSIEDYFTFYWHFQVAKIKLTQWINNNRGSGHA